jgi:UDP-3-O-[3-hydroxymyristoyl] glucosamine N-acyltransferase
MKIELKLSDILSLIHETPDVVGHCEGPISGFASLGSARKGDLSFVQGKKYAQKAATCKATALLIPRSLDLDAPDVAVQIKVDNPSQALTEICASLERTLFPLPYTGIDALSVISEGCKFEKSVSVGAFTVIEEGAGIGKNSFIGRRVTIGAHSIIGEGVYIADNVVIAPHTEIGDACNIYSGVVIGSPGFGYDFNKEKGRHDPIPQVGRVCIGSNVDIGANSAVDRARFGVTRIGEGTKIDNMVQIGHNVEIGKHCILCAQIGIGGSAIIGDYVIMGGQVGMADHTEVAAMTQIGAGAGITSSISIPGSKLWGTPAIDYRLATKVAVLQKRLPELFKRFGQLEDDLKSLKPSE